MICAIRIKGQIGNRRDFEETMFRLRLRKKYSCVVLPSDKKEQVGMIHKLKDFVAFGELDDATFVKLVEARGKLLDKSKKMDAKKIVEELKKGKSYEEVGLKPFFSLHPARGGIDTKLHVGVKKGVLGHQKDAINKLVERVSY